MDEQPKPTLEQLAQEIQDHIDEGDRNVTRGVQEWIEAGRKLSQARELCAHGTWESWIGENFQNLSYRTAMSYINMFERFGDKPASVAGLSGPIVRMLSMPSTPQDIVDAVLAEAAAQGGRVITYSDVQRQIYEAKRGPAPDAPRPTFRVTYTEPIVADPSTFRIVRSEPVVARPVSTIVRREGEPLIPSFAAVPLPTAPEGLVGKAILSAEDMASLVSIMVKAALCVVPKGLRSDQRAEAAQRAGKELLQMDVLQ